MQQNKHGIHKQNSKESENTHIIPDPHLSHMGNLSALPTEDATFVEGAFTLLNPDGLSESPTKSRQSHKQFLLETYFSFVPSHQIATI